MSAQWVARIYWIENVFLFTAEINYLFITGTTSGVKGNCYTIFYWNKVFWNIWRNKNCKSYHISTHPADLGYPLSVFKSFIYNFVFYQVYVFGRGYADKNIDIPYHMIAISLISFVIPMAIGVFVKHKKPELADRIQSLVSRFTLCFSTIHILHLTEI